MIYYVTCYQCHIILHFTVSYYVILHQILVYQIIAYNVIRYIMWCDLMWYDAVQYKAIQRNTTQYNAIQRNTTQYNTIKNNDDLYSTATTFVLQAGTYLTSYWILNYKILSMRNEKYITNIYSSVVVSSSGSHKRNRMSFSAKWDCYLTNATLSCIDVSHMSRKWQRLLYFN